MEDVQHYMKISDEVSSLLEPRRGLRRGDRISCLLFNIEFEGVMQ